MINKNNYLIKLSTPSGEPIFPLIMKDNSGDLLSKNKPQLIFNDRSPELKSYSENIIKNISIANGSSKGLVMCMENHYNFSKWPGFTLDSELDIYSVSEIGEKPALFNDIMNTRYSENGAYLNNDTLYFSTNGLYGFGGYDIYMSTNAKGSWSYPKNLGAWINTIYDDVSYRKIEGIDVFICDSSAPNGKTIASTTSEIPEDREIYTMKIVLPDSIKVKSPYLNRIKVYVIDDNNKRIPVWHSFFNDDGLNRYVYVTLGVDASLPKLEIVKYGQSGISKYVTDPISFDPKDVYYNRNNINIQDYNQAALVLKENKPVINGHDENSYTCRLIDLPTNMQPDKNYPVTWEVAFPDDTITVFLTQEVKITNGLIPILEYGKCEKVIEVNSVKNFELEKGASDEFTIYFKTDERSISSFDKYKDITSTLDNGFLNFIKNNKDDLTDWIFNENEDQIVLMIDFEGWADTTFNSGYNDTLSLDRAKTMQLLVTDPLLNPEIPKYLRIGSVSGKGETTKFGEELRENRRVNITIKWLK